MKTIERLAQIETKLKYIERENFVIIAALAAQMGFTYIPLIIATFIN